MAQVTQQCQDVMTKRV